MAPALTAFLSHAGEDKADFVEPLGRELAALGIRPWLDKWEIRPGDSLVTKLFDEGLATVDAVIVVVSQHSAGKPWVRAELDAARVRQITENTRLIPVRLDSADMPAPLKKMLLWHDAARTEDGVRHAARRIADTIHGLDPRPAVAPPPAYTSAARIPGLTAADSTLLATIAEEAIAVNNLLWVSWPAITSIPQGPRRDARPGVPGRAGAASLRQARSCPCRRRHPRGGTRRVSSAVADTVVPGAEGARQRIIASLVNTPPEGITVVDDLAVLTDTPPLFVLQFLRELQAQGHLTVILTAGGYSRIASVSPTLPKRLLS